MKCNCARTEEDDCKRLEGETNEPFLTRIKTSSCTRARVDFTYTLPPMVIKVLVRATILDSSGENILTRSSIVENEVVSRND